MAKSTIESRLAALEAEVAQLKARVAELGKSDIPWWEKIAGSFANDPTYHEAMRSGREYRDSLRPKRRSRRKSP